MNSLMTNAAGSYRAAVVPNMLHTRAAGAPPHSLAAHGLLNLLPEPDLVDLLQWAKIRAPRRREVIFREGEAGGNVVFVLEGFVKLSMTLADGREVVLDVIGPSGCVGEMAVLNKMPQDTDATALVRCRLLVVDGRQFRRAFERRPEGLPTILRLVSERLHRAREQMIDTLALSAPARLAKALLRLAMLWSPGPLPGDKVHLRLSQSEIGSMTGLSRESVNKLLGCWRDAGWIRLSNRSVILLDMSALASLSRTGLADE